MDYKKELDDLIKTLITQGGSDLHLSEGRHPTIRVARELIPLVKKNALTEKDTSAFLDILLSPGNKAHFQLNKEIDFSYNFNDQARFRGNGFYQQGKVSIALRLIPKSIASVKDLHLPEVLETFARKQQGFFLVVGPVGQGKTTTLAALIELINQERAEHIITIEDPIEYIYEQKKAIIDQREVRVDTADFKTALVSVLREDVNVILLGEMRDPETMAAAVTAAETGHLVFSTLHTNNASQTIDRIIDSFPAEQQNQIRVQLAGALTGVFSQRLVPRISGGLIPIYELLIANNAVANLIREKRTHEINTVIETSSDEGMIDMNRSIVELIRAGEITIENGYKHSFDPKVLEKML
ncbi:MAG TPA: PilT/PilU family type 4a pilus ATPase [Candidatus Paceibacterota bacterium]|nr:PilT/PilU family type 4a pilus ATPase [Candidatus Paceibacterota bacterium]